MGSTSCPRGHCHNPIAFDEFIEQELEESISPFLTASSRHLGKDLHLKSSFVAAILLLVAFALSFSPSLVPLSNIVLISVFILAGIPSLIESIRDIINLDINIDVLMILAAFLSILIGSSMEGGLLLVLFAFSGALEENVTGKARSTIHSLHNLAPNRAVVLDDDGLLHERAVKDIIPGTKILIKAGEVVPLDGVVIEGDSSVNLVHLTGENFPVIKKVKNNVPAGARNLEGRLILRVSKSSGDSTLAKIIDLITEAQSARPKLQRWLDRVSRRYSTSVILFTFAAAALPPLFTSIPYLGDEGSIYRALAFLIAASPCALIIAVPIAYLSAISACARRGVLLKGGVVLDALASCSAIAFDKTGTLTTGDLQCTLIEPLGQWDNVQDVSKALSIATALERNAVHPIAKAINKWAKEKNIAPANLKDFRSKPGFGLEGSVDIKGKIISVAIGHPEFIASKLHKEQKNKLLAFCEQAQRKGELLTILLMDQQVANIHFLDTLRPTTQNTVQALKDELNMRTLILSGDHYASVSNIAKQTKITEYHANLRPEDKLQKVSQISQDQGLIMVGDGVNDAPALARATTGISMGKVGSTTTIDVSDVVLLHDNIEILPWLLKKAQHSQSIVKQNVTLAGAVIILASLAALLGLIPLWLAVILHEGGTVIVGLNSLRLLK